MFAQLIRSALAFCLWMAAATAVHAQACGTVQYAPTAAPSQVPTLAQWLVVALGLLVACLAWYHRDSRAAARLMLVGAVAAASWGMLELTPPAQAQAAASMTNGAGGTVAPCGLSTITNNTSVPQQIGSINVPLGCLNNTATLTPPPQLCQVGVIVPPGQSCQISFNGVCPS